MPSKLRGRSPSAQPTVAPSDSNERFASADRRTPMYAASKSAGRRSGRVSPSGCRSVPGTTATPTTPSLPSAGSARSAMPASITRC